MSWTDERVALLGKLWKEGKTAKEIAQALGEGVTRNAVIGKAHRMNLSGRASPIQGSKSAKTGSGAKKGASASKPAEAGNKAGAQTGNPQSKADKPGSKQKSTSFPKPANINERAVPASGKPEKKSKAQFATDHKADVSKGDMTLQNLKDSMCRWPHGDPQEEGFHFCADRKVPGFPYCEDHVKAAYQTKKKSKILNPEALENKAKDEDENEDSREQIA